MLVSGKSILSLRLQTEEQFNLDEPVEAQLGMSGDMNQQELNELQTKLASGGLTLLAPVEIGNGPWPNTLRLRFRRPARKNISLVLLSSLITGKEILGWKLFELGLDKPAKG